MAGSFRAGFDGGSRGNPGPAAWGVVILDEAGRPIQGHAGAIGRATNNVAEYRGLLEALALAERAGAADVRLFADSELVVKQMRGEYKVRHPDLVPLHAEATRRAAAFQRFSIAHVPRERNKDADRLVNRALNLGADSRVEERFDVPAPSE
jgi:probable phosphoglycerate mutase